MPQSVKQKPKVGALVPTRTTGIYRRRKADNKDTFYCRYTRPDGKRPFEAAGSFDAAKARLAEVQGRLSKGEVVGDPTATLRQVVEQWRETRTHVKPRTRETEEAHIRLYFGPLLRLRVRDINRAKVVGWLAGLVRQDGKDGPLNDGTKATVLATLSSVLDYAVLADIISVNPVKTLDKKPTQGKIKARILGDGELDDLLASCKRFSWLRDIVLITLYGALRLGEACGLSWGDVDFKNGQLHIRQALSKDGRRLGTPKGGKEATIPMSPQARVLLAELRLKAGAVADDTPVFRNTLGGRRNPRDVQRAFDKARRYAGLSTEPRALRFHDLRHSSISMLANRPGADMLQVQLFARHASLQTTLGYIHPHEKPEWAEEMGEAFVAFGGAS